MIFCWFSKFRGGKTFFGSWLKLNNSISVRNCKIVPPISDEDHIKGLQSVLVLVLDHTFTLSVKWVLLAKKLRGPGILCPLQCQTRGAPPLHPEIDANDLQYKLLTKWSFQVELFIIFNTMFWRIWISLIAVLAALSSQEYLIICMKRIIHSIKIWGFWY